MAGALDEVFDKEKNREIGLTQNGYVAKKRQTKGTKHAKTLIRETFAQTLNQNGLSLPEEIVTAIRARDLGLLPHLVSLLEFVAPKIKAMSLDELEGKPEQATPSTTINIASSSDLIELISSAR